MDIHRILKKLPHRYPILLVDRVLELEKDVRIRALKNVTINEPFFAGHFPARPVMPGVLMLEALAQTAALLSLASEGIALDDRRWCTSSASTARASSAWSSPATSWSWRRRCCAPARASTSTGTVARVGDDVAAEAELMCTMRSVA